MKKSEPMCKKEIIKRWENLFKAVGVLDKGYICESLDYLSPREKNILEFRFGLKDGIVRTLEETAKKMGVTRERIRQVQARAIEKIRKINRTIT